MPLKINCKSLLLYALFILMLVLSGAAMPCVPLGIGFYFAFLLCGADLIATPLLYIACSAVSLNLIVSALSVFEASFLCAVTFFYRKFQKKIKWECPVYLLIALLPFLFFSPWQGIEGITLPSPYLARGLAAVICTAFTFFCLKATYCIVFRLFRALPQEIELLSLAIIGAVCSTGFYNLLGEVALLAVTLALCVLSVRLFRNATAVALCSLWAFYLSSASLSLLPVPVFVAGSMCMLLFLRAGRLTPSIMLCPFAALYAYQTGLAEGALWQTIVYALLLLLACLLPALPSDKCLKRLKQKLYGTPLLPERQQNILHERMGEKLFRISDVFREIQQAFTAMDEGIDEEGAQTRLFNELKERSCRLCDRAAVCEKTNVYSGFHKLIHAGCVKGKVNLIDLPSEITVNCSHPSDLIARLNASLAEYRRYMTEAENARAGRLLLAEQAQGIADVMKNAAVELSRIPADNSELTSALTKAFAKKAIACYEIGITGEENLTISAILSTDCKVTLVQDILFEVCHIPFILQEKVVYDSLKTCYIFVHPPKYDAAFGVAFATKQGESISGDTHSVVRINEHSFLATLSDGMGSGEYAQKISATAISLVEAFYRAQMPRDTVLDTINKLLSYRRDERFACLDIAAIDLNSGEAEFVKIGAPVSLIVRSGNLIVLEGEGLPLGIIESVKPTVAKQTLKGDDIVVFMSDGITSAYHSTPELCEYVQKLSPLNPQNLADQLLKEAMSRTGGVADDDMTILCVRIFEPQRAAN